MRDVTDLASMMAARTAEDFRTAGSLKWTTYPQTIGAWVAEMDFGLAPVIEDAIRPLLSKRLTGYTPMSLREELQQATTEWLAHRYHWQIRPEQVMALPDVLTGLTILLNHLAPQGKVIVPTPAYMPFLDMPAAHGRDLIELPMIRREDHWEFDYDGLERAFAAGGRVLIMCNPHNPIGKMYSADEMRKIAEIVDAHDGWVFNDEIHAPLTYSGRQHVPYPTVSEAAARHSVTAMSASKSFNIAGLKCAQLIVTNPEQQQWISQHAHGLPYSAAGLGVAANIAAFRHGEPWLNEVIGYLEHNRDLALQLVADKLPKVDVIKPEATFLLWLDCSQTGLDDPMNQFLAAGVAMNDGLTCGQVGTRHVRFNFATSTGVIEEAIDLMARALA